MPHARLAVLHVLLAAVLAAQDGAATRWTLAPPAPGKPCPSHEAKVEDGKFLMGEFAFATKKPPVVDGDTLRFDDMDGTIRMLGLDAEETFKDKAKERLAAESWSEYVKGELAGKNPARPPKYATPMGMAAKDAMEQLVAGTARARVEFDELDRKKDGYDRYLAYVLIRRGDGWLNLNVEMVRQGLSPYFEKYGRCKRRHDAFVAAENEAREAKRGIWGPTAPIKHYGDYDVRKKWWTERRDALETAEALRAQRDDLFLLGRPEEWERLKKAEGRVVTVVSTVNGVKTAGKLGLLGLAHDKRNDFQIVGDDATVRALDAPKKFDGDLVYVTGKVELYKESPQFRHAADKPVTFSKTPPPAPAAPAK